MLLAVEVADCSLDYDLNRKPRIYAAHGVHELWVIDTKRRVTHVHDTLGPDGYARIITKGSGERLQPSRAPMDFAFALDDLEDI